jgi:predicted component of type VI protein secretion system
MDVLEILKLLPGGSAVLAVIIVVILFLKQQEKMNDVLKEITDKFGQQSSANQKLFQDQINQITTQYYTSQKSFQDQIQLLIDSHLAVSKETISALKQLEAIVRQVELRVTNAK